MRMLPVGLSAQLSLSERGHCHPLLATEGSAEEPLPFVQRSRTEGEAGHLACFCSPDCSRFVLKKKSAWPAIGLRCHASQAAKPRFRSSKESGVVLPIGYRTFFMGGQAERLS